MKYHWNDGGVSRFGQGYVDSGSKVYWCTCNHDDLYHEGREGERVVVHDDSSRISDNLGQAASNHKGHEPPTLPSDAEVDMNAHGQREEDEEDGVCWEGGSVLVHAPGDRA